MKPEERAWLDALRAFTEFVRAEAPHTIDGFTGFLALLTPLVEDPATPPAAKYEEARRLQGIYGGMGSVNDYPWSAGAEAAKEKLYVAIEDVLRLYWADMGRPVHDPASVPVPAVGATVRLTAGRPMLIDRDAREIAVTQRLARRRWRVVSHQRPDISGMPTVLLVSGRTYQLARVDALENATRSAGSRSRSRARARPAAPPPGPPSKRRSDPE